MIKILLLTVAMLCSHLLYAQTCAPNGITTNPSAPVNNQNPSKRNTFDFTAAQFPLNWIYNYNNTNFINSPYFTTDNPGVNIFYDPLDGIKDVYPRDGWELIKHDFGYNDDGTPKNPATANPYLVLYNKYTAKLRVFVARGDQKQYNGANIEIRFIDGTPMETSLLDFTSELKAIDAPFVKYQRITSIAPFLDLPLKWFYADFQMQYDPCTCLFQSRLQINITLSSTSTISLEGTTSGTLVSQGKPTDAQEGKSRFTIGDAKTLGKKIGEGYKSGNSLKTELTNIFDGQNTSATDKSNKKAGITNLNNAMKDGSFLKSGLSAIPYLGAAVSVLDFFMAGAKEPPAPQPVELQPMVINMTSRFKGEILTQTPYNTFTFRTPGSFYNNYPNSEYPIIMKC